MPKEILLKKIILNKVKSGVLTHKCCFSAC